MTDVQAQPRGMTPTHPAWPRFYNLLSGPEGCNFVEGADGKPIWTCHGGFDKRFAWSILTRYFPQVDPVASMNYFEAHGGHCDCEVLFNAGA